MLRSRNTWNVWMVVMVVVLMAAASTHAAITKWTGGGDGTRWSDPLNWDNGVPGGTDTAALWGNVGGGTSITVYVEEGDQAVNNIETFRGVILEGTDQDDATERKLTLNGNITGVLGASDHSGTVSIKCDLELTGDTVWDVTARAGSTIAVSRVVSETVQSDITIRNTGTSTNDSTFSADPTITGDLIILEGRTQALVTGWGSTLNSIILGDTTGDKDVVLATGSGQSIVAPIVVRAGSSGYRGIQVGHTWNGGTLTGPTIALGGDLTFVNNGPLAVYNTMSGVGGVVQNGATTIGTRLTADNTNQGDTDVTTGVLIVAGTTSGQGDYIIRADGSLTGDGQIGLASGKAVTVQSGGTLLPGNCTSTRTPLTTQVIGELTIDGDLVLLDGAELEFQLGDDVVAGTDYDTVTLLSDLTLDGTLNVTQMGGFDATTGVYTLFSGVDALTDNGLETSGLDGIDHWIDTTQTGFVYLRTGETAPIAAIPEPAGLGLIGLALLAVRRKRSPL